MKQHTFSILFWLGTFLPGLFTACSDDMSGKQSATVTVDDSNLVETKLLLNVAAMNTDAVTSRADDDDKLSGNITEADKLGSEAERKIDNIWVFQFNAAGNQLLITPRYYDLSGKDIVPDETTGKEVEVLLKPGVSSIVYVVANAGKKNSEDSDWATVDNSATLEIVKKLTLPSPNYIAVGIDNQIISATGKSILPMEGETEAITPGKDETIKVKVTRMYSKVEITIGNIPESLELTSVTVYNMPYYCQVGTLAPADPKYEATYPDNEEWHSYSFDPGKKDNDDRYTGKMVIYLPENLQGRTDTNENNPELKTANAPDNALRVEFVANYVDIFTGEEKERGRRYVVYPGANNYNDYNIKRNFIYRVKINLYTDIYEQDIPSSNCFVVKPKQVLSFLPYYRTEEGGGYKFTNYLDAKGDDETKKINDSENRLDNVRIIWQTENAIGDNSNGDLVWIDRHSEATDEFHRKIHVKTGQKGNALIAAYNSQGDIIWSWHIWVTENEPANVSNALVYSTYAWNEKGIQNHVRVPGYAIMPCNLGALRYAPDNASRETIFDTYGMLYQWGRKDPFPPMKKDTPKDFSYYNYDNETARIHVYDNKHEYITMTSSGFYQDNKEGDLFRTTLASDIAPYTQAGGLRYSIQNPVVFIASANKAFSKGNNYNVPGNYINRGDWLPEGDECLWGAVARDEEMKVYKYPGEERHLWDNYGSQKTIFDPCPSGWRVPPGDLWLGFTVDGLNYAYNWDKINCVETDKNTIMNQNGYTMYLQQWHTGNSSFFPTQGSRLASGECLLGGTCGNYHNATTDQSLHNLVTSDGTYIDRVNILHLHSAAGDAKVNIFEDQLLYYVKSVAGPIRCVRDHK